MRTDGHGHTTVIQRVLERRAQQPPTIQDDTASTIAVMLLLSAASAAPCSAVGDRSLCGHIRGRVAPDMLDFEVAEDDATAIDMFRQEFRPVVLTDSLEIIRSLRSQQADRIPFIVYISWSPGRSRRARGRAHRRRGRVYRTSLTGSGAARSCWFGAAHRRARSGVTYRAHRESQALHHRRSDTRWRAGAFSANTFHGGRARRSLLIVTRSHSSCATSIFSSASMTHSATRVAIRC